MMPIGFDQVKELVDAIILWLKEFFENVEKMFGEVHYEMKGWEVASSENAAD